MGRKKKIYPADTEFATVTIYFGDKIGKYKAVKKHFGKNHQDLIRTILLKLNSKIPENKELIDAFIEYADSNRELIRQKGATTTAKVITLEKIHIDFIESWSEYLTEILESNKMISSSSFMVIYIHFLYDFFKIKKTALKGPPSY